MRSSLQPTHIQRRLLQALVFQKLGHEIPGGAEARTDGGDNRIVDAKLLPAIEGIFFSESFHLVEAVLHRQSLQHQDMCSNSKLVLVRGAFVGHPKHSLHQLTRRILRLFYHAEAIFLRILEISAFISVGVSRRSR